MATATRPAQPDPHPTGTARDGDNLITMKEIRAKFRLGRTAGYELVRRPDFPARIVISPRCHRWVQGEVDAFGETIRDRPVTRGVAIIRQAQPPGRAAAPRRLTGEEHPVRARKDSR
jgi:predicted DNA-binding transcriptional regulator AlpA